MVTMTDTTMHTCTPLTEYTDTKSYCWQEYWPKHQVIQYGDYDPPPKKKENL